MTMVFIIYNKIDTFCWNIDIFCWNIKGFNHFSKRRSFKHWLRRNRPYFGSLVETHVRKHKSQMFVKSTFPSWNFAANYDFAELGRIWVIWDSSVKVTVISKSEQMITIIVQLPHSTMEFVVSFAYVINCKYDRRKLWEEIETIASWLIMGDFNQILNPLESFTGRIRISKSIQDFKDCLTNSCFSDLSF